MTRAHQKAGPEDDRAYWIALTLIQDIGPVTAKRLLSRFHSPRRIFGAGSGELRAIDDIKDARAARIREFSEWDRVERDLATMERLGVSMITCQDSSYPPSLRHLDDSPLLLYAKGAILERDRYAVSIVGSRSMSDYGRRIAARLAGDLAQVGITVVSGMARGIDSVAHRGALQAGGRSIAVLGSGIDRPYPPENKRLFDDLSQSGSVVTEFPIGAPPNREHFPKRNRLISGLSLGVLVVEAAPDSGSLITAHYALEQGKEVFAVPGAITAKNSEGTNGLIKGGAKLVQRVDDILDEIAAHLKGLPVADPLSRDRPAPSGQGKLEITDEERTLCSVLGTEPKHIDTIARETGTAPPRLSSLLLNLELKGVVRRSEGTRFSLA